MPFRTGRRLPLNLGELPVDALSELLESAREAGDTGLILLYSDALAEHAREWIPQDYQRIPEGVWTLWLFLAGRFTGKTDAGAHAFNEHAEGPPCDTRVPGGHRMRLIGPTFTDTVASCVNGPTGLKAHNPKIELLTTKEGTIVRWPNGAVARIFGAYTPEDPERLRAGGNSSLIAETPVITRRGVRPIAEVEVGDEVLTRSGWSAVLISALDAVEEVWAIETDAGPAWCSASHEWLTARGWIATRDLRTSDSILAWNESWKPTDAVGTDERTATTATAGMASCIATSTRRRSDPSPPALTSTIAMETRPTTSHRTSSPLAPASTSRSTLAASSGIRQEGAQRGGAAPFSAAPARTVAECSERATPALVSARRYAPSGITSALEPGVHTRDGCVRCAARSSRLAANAVPVLALARVRRCSPTGIVASLYDLMVEHDHEFVLANGLLSGNCFDWWEEAAAWRQLDACFDQATFGLRLGDHSQAIATTTPKNRAKIRELRALGEEFAKLDTDAQGQMIRASRVHLTIATTMDNRYGDPEVRESLYATYAGTRLGAQELEAQILDDLGTFFSRAWFGWLDAPTMLPRKVRSWDLAGTPPGPANEDPDWSVGALIAYDPAPQPWKLADGTVIHAGRFVIEDVIRLRDSPAQVEQAVVDAARRDGPTVKVVIEREPGQSGKSQLAHFSQALQGVALVEEFSPSGPKAVRAQLVSGAAQQGRVEIVRAPWNQAMLDEMEEFTGTSLDHHDDQIDALSQGFAALEGRGGLASAQAPSGQLPSRSEILGGRRSFADSMRRR